MTEVRCCCDPSNLMGHVPEHSGMAAGLGLQELDDGTMAFSGEGRDLGTLGAISGFEAAPRSLHRKGGKGGKKTWRKK